MSYHAPKVKDVVEKTPDPVINMAETSGLVNNNKRKQGLLSTFMGNTMGNARSAGMLSGLINKQQPTLGNQVTD